jgi:hypothetical protein
MVELALASNNPVSTFAKLADEEAEAALLERV